MALRTIRVLGDPILEKACKPVSKMNGRTRELIEDMFDTMYESSGVGLAAPQVGILKQIFVIDTTEAVEERDGGTAEGEEGACYVCINPQIEVIGEETETGDEACLSVPGKQGAVTRPKKIHVRAFDENMQLFELEAEGLLARAMMHEYDHLSGVMYTSKVEGPLKDAEYEEG